MDAHITGAYGTMYYVNDMKKAVAFYKEVMGLKALHESEDWTEFDLHGHALCLHSVAPGQKAPENGYLIMKVNGIHRTYEEMKKLGVEFETELKQVHPGAYCVAFRDAVGNRVDLYEDTNPV